MSRDQGESVNFSEEQHETMESVALGLQVVASTRRDDTPSEDEIAELKALAFGKKDTPIPKRRSSPPPPLPPDVHDTKGSNIKLDSDVIIEEDSRDRRPATMAAAPRSLEDIGQLETVRGDIPASDYPFYHVVGTIGIGSNVPVEVIKPEDPNFPQHLKTGEMPKPGLHMPSDEDSYLDGLSSRLDNADLEALGEAETALPNTYETPVAPGWVMVREEKSTDPAKEATAQLDLESDVEILGDVADFESETHELDAEDDIEFMDAAIAFDRHGAAVDPSTGVTLYKRPRRRVSRTRKLIAAGVCALLSVVSASYFHAPNFSKTESRSIGTTTSIEQRAPMLPDIYLQTDTVEEPNHIASFIELSQREINSGHPLSDRDRQIIHDGVESAGRNGRDFHILGLSTPSGPRRLNDILSSSRANIVAAEAVDYAQTLPDDRRPEILTRSDSLRYGGIERSNGIGGVLMTDAPHEEGPVLASLVERENYLELDAEHSTHLETEGEHGYSPFTPVDAPRAVPDRVMVASAPAGNMHSAGHIPIQPDYTDAELQEILEEEEPEEIELTDEMLEAMIQIPDDEITDEQIASIMERYNERSLRDARQITELRRAYAAARDHVNWVPEHVSEQDHRRIGNCEHRRDAMIDASRAELAPRTRRASRQMEAIQAAYDRCVSRAEEQQENQDLPLHRDAEMHLARVMSQLRTVVAADSARPQYRVIAQQILNLAERHQLQGEINFGSDLAAGDVISDEMDALQEWVAEYDSTHPSVRVSVPEERGNLRADEEREPFEINYEFSPLGARAEQLAEEIPESEGAEREQLEARAQEVIAASRAHAEATDRDVGHEVSALEQAITRERPNSCRPKGQDAAYKSVVELQERLETEAHDANQIQRGAQDASYRIVEDLVDQLEGEYNARIRTEEEAVSSARLQVGARAYVNGGDEDMIVRNIGVTREQLYDAATELMLGEGTLLEEPELEVRPAQDIEYKIAA